MYIRFMWYMYYKFMYHIYLHVNSSYSFCILYPHTQKLTHVLAYFDLCIYRDLG